MTKIAKRIMLIVSSFLFVLCLGVSGLLGLNTMSAKAADGATVEFRGFGTHNNTAWNDSFDAVDLAFSGDFTAATEGITSGSITYTKPDEQAQPFQYYWANINNCGANVVELLCWKGAMTEGTVLNIQGGTVIGGQTLPELTFTLTNGVWVKEGDPTVKFTGFGSLNNDAWTDASYEAVYLEFDRTFAVNTQEITSGSVTYTKPGATAQKFSFNWANINGCGENVVAFVYVAGTMTEGTVLKIDGGTKIGGQTLPELIFILKSGAWVKMTTDPTVEFTGFGAHNNTAWSNSYDAVDLAFNGDFAAATQALTAGSITYTYPGSSTPNDFTYYWANINGCGTNVVELLYATGCMQEGTVLKVKKGTIIGGQTLPELTLYMVNGEWCTYNPTVSFTGIRADQNNAAWEQSPTTHTATFLQFTGGSFNKEVMIDTPSYVEGIYWTAPNSDTPNYFSNYWVTGSLDTIKLLNGIATEIPEGSTLHVVGGTNFQGQVLPEVTLTMAYGQWYEEVPTSAEFHSIANNHVTGTNLAKMVRIQFSGASASTNGIAASNTYALGNNLKLNGTPVNELGWLISHNATSAKINFEYASLPEFSDSVKQIKLELTQTTVFGDIAIQPFTIYYNGETNLWQTEIYVNVSMANFVSTDGEWKAGYGNADQRVLYLEFDRALAPTTTSLWGDKNDYAASSSGNLMSQMTIGGEHVTFGAQIILFIEVFATNKDSKTLEIMFVNNYFTEMTHGDILYIPEGTLFGDVALSEVKLYYNATEAKWQTAPIVDGFTTEVGGSIRINNDGHNGLRFESHIDYAIYNALVSQYGEANIQLGTYILPEDYLVLSGKTLREYVTTYTEEGGYYLDISTWNTDKKANGFANGGENGSAETDGYYKYYGTISDLKIENYVRNFIGVGYLKITDGDQVYFYLTHDGDWSRNVYYIAQEAHKDTTEEYSETSLNVLKGYLDKVVVLETSTVNNAPTLVDVSSACATEARPYTHAANYTCAFDAETGVITISTTEEFGIHVVINGVSAGVIAKGETKYADFYAVNAKLTETAEEAKALNFGFAEPNIDLYSQNNEGFDSMFNGETNQYSTASNIAKVTAEFDGNSARIWFQTADLCWSRSPSNELVFNEDCLNELKKVISDFRAQGVTNISLMSSVANTQTTKNFYIDGEWYNNAEATTQVAAGKTLDGMALGLVVLPNEEDYSTFLALQKEYFKQLALEVGNSVTTIEILNEMEGATNYRFHYKNGYLPDINLIAQAAMDICKEATDGIKEAGKNIKVAMPALMTVSELQKGGKTVRYESKAFVEAEYAYIMGANGTKDADDYFQIINMHPYVTLSSATSDTNYLYYEDDSLTVQTPAQMKERWLDYMNSMREIFVKNGDAEKPIWITEFGLADYEQCDGEKTGIDGNKYNDYRTKTLLRQAQVYQSIYDAMISLPYLDTVLFFRLGDYGHSGEHGYGVCGEASYGVIDKDGNLKDFGKYLYAIANGVNVFNDSSYAQLKSLSELGEINGKTVDQLATNVNNIY